jgi:hypothetical protein
LLFISKRISLTRKRFSERASRIASRIGPVKSDFRIKIAALSARSFRDAVERLARCKQLTCPEEIRLVERGNACAVQFVWLLAHETEPPLLVDVCFACILAIGRRGTGRPLNPKRVEPERAATHREMYEAHFDSPVKFKSNRSSLVFNKADIEL